jgi:hypothetical protein
VSIDFLTSVYLGRGEPGDVKRSIGKGHFMFQKKILDVISLNHI